MKNLKRLIQIILTSITLVLFISSIVLIGQGGIIYSKSLSPILCNILDWTILLTLGLHFNESLKSFNYSNKSKINSHLKRAINKF